MLRPDRMLLSWDIRCTLVVWQLIAGPQLARKNIPFLPSIPQSTSEAAATPREIPCIRFWRFFRRYARYFPSTASSSTFHDVMLHDVTLASYAPKSGSVTMISAFHWCAARICRACVCFIRTGVLDLLSALAADVASSGLRSFDDRKELSCRGTGIPRRCLFIAAAGYSSHSVSFPTSCDEMAQSRRRNA